MQYSTESFLFGHGRGEQPSPIRQVARLLLGRVEPRTDELALRPFPTGMGACCSGIMPKSLILEELAQRIASQVCALLSLWNPHGSSQTKSYQCQ